MDQDAFDLIATASKAAWDAGEFNTAAALRGQAQDVVGTEGVVRQGADGTLSVYTGG
jgi:hypothetical protein